MDYEDETSEYDTSEIGCGEESENMSDGEAASGEIPWHQDGYSYSSFEDEPAEEEMEPKPPDITWSHTYQTPHTLEPMINFDSDYESYDSEDDYKSNSLTFSGYSKEPGTYLRWETNMKRWLNSNNIPKEEKLSYALDALVGKAYKWWVQEDARTYYSNPVLNWGDLKVRMYGEFVRKLKNPINAPTKSFYQESPRSGISKPKPPPTLEHKYTYVHKARRVFLNTSKKQKGNKQTVQVKEVQPKSTPPPSLEPKDKYPQGKSSELPKSKEVICYRCHKRGHFAATCPTRPLEQKSKSLISNDSLVQPDHKIPNHCIMHLSLSRDVETGIRRTKDADILSKDPEHGRGVLPSMLIKEEPPDAPRITKSTTCRGKMLDSQNRMEPNLLSLCADKSVLRTKLFEGGGNDAAITTSNHGEVRCNGHASLDKGKGETISLVGQVNGEGETTVIDLPSLDSNPITKKPSSHSEEVVRPAAEPELNRSECKQPNGPDCDICPVQGAYRTSQEDLSHNPNCSGNSTHQGLAANWNGVQRSSDIPGIEFTNRVIPEHLAIEANADIWPLFDVLQLKNKDSESETTWRTLSTHLEHISKWIHPNWSSDEGVIQFSNWVILNLAESGIRALIGRFRLNREELSCKPTCSGILIQYRSSENWIHAKTGFGLEDIQFPNRRFLDLPYLEPSKLGRLQTYLWRPGDLFHQLEAPNIIYNFTPSHWIKWIQSQPSKYQDLPYMDSDEDLVDQWLYFVDLLNTHEFESFYIIQRVPRYHLYMPKLSRYKKTTTFLIWPILSSILQRLVFHLVL